MMIGEVEYVKIKVSHSKYACTENVLKCWICLKTFGMISMCLDDCTYKVASPYKVFNLLAVVNMSQKDTSRFMGGVHPFLWGATETTFH